MMCSDTCALPPAPEQSKPIAPPSSFTNALWRTAALAVRSPWTLACSLVSAGLVFGMSRATAAADFPYLARAEVIFYASAAALGWLGLIALAALAYVWDADADAAPRRLRRWAGCALAAAVFSTVPFLLMAEYVEASQWARLFGLGALALLLGTVLRSETLSTWRRFESTRLMKNNAHWLRLAVASAAVIFVVETTQIAFCGRFPMLPFAGAVAMNTVLVLLLTMAIFAVTNRFAFAVGLVCSAASIAVVANILKMHYLQAIIRPLDVQYLLAFSHYFTYFFGKTAAIASVAGVVIWIGLMAILWRGSRYRAALTTRLCLGAIALVGITTLMTVERVPTVRRAMKWANMHKNLSNGIYSVRRRGLLFEFFSDIPDSFPKAPPGYSKAAVARAVEEYYPRSAPVAPPIDREESVNIVFYLMESFINPDDFRIRFTADPIPNFRAAAAEHTQGRAIVPNECFGSVNTEFELLTGMSSSFLPKGACSYVQIVKRNLPTVPGFLKSQGYRTLAVHSGPPILYSRLQVYPYFHIDHTVWLAKKDEGRQVALDIVGRWPDDKSVVDAIIDISKHNRRYFVFAFPTCTHSPYDYDHYRNSKLDIAQPMPPAAHKELKAYINALRHADQELGRMLDYFRRRPEKTVVLVLGDHIPPFGNAEIYAAAGLSADAQAPGALGRRQVPLLVWSNFLPKEPDLVCSTNFLCTYVLSKIGIAPTGFLAMNDAVRAKFSILSNDRLATRDGTPLEPDAVPAPLERLIDAYRLLQYDILFGKQYSLAQP